MRNLKIVILDWDGVFVLSHYFYYKLVEIVFRAFSKKCPSLRSYRNEVGFLGVRGFYEKHGIKNFAKVRKMEKEDREGRLSEIKINHEVRFLVAVCRALGMKTIILSNNYKGVIRSVLERSHISVDEVHSSKDKARSIEEILKRHGVKPNHVIFVSDGTKDILDGKKTGVQTIGYSGGYVTYAKIRKVCPDFGGDKKITSLQDVGMIILERR